MASATNLVPQPQPTAEVLNKDGTFTTVWRNYWFGLDNVFRNAQYGPVPQAANDAAAAAAGVPINGMYRNGSQVMIRVV